MRRTALLALPLMALPLAFAAPAQAEESVDITLNPLNTSGASGTATVTANDNGSLSVDITGSGYVPNSPHAQHIHGDASGDFTCPTAADDKDGDGVLTVEEGLPKYGGVFVSLTTKGDTSADSGLAVDRMPVADADGNLSYSRTIAASALPAGATDNLDSLHIVQHGIDANGNDQYDLQALGESSFAKSLGVDGIPEEATDPATCGQIQPAGGVDTGGSPTASTNSASQLPLYALGGAALLGAGGVFAGRRRLSGSAS